MLPFHRAILLEIQSSSAMLEGVSPKERAAEITVLLKVLRNSQMPGFAVLETARTLEKLPERLNEFHFITVANMAREVLKQLSSRMR